MKLGAVYLQELETESTATRKCLERMKSEFYNYKPHEKSMIMGYLWTVVADIPSWIATAIEKSEIDFATYPKVELKTPEDAVKHFDQKMAAAKKALQHVSDEELNTTFSLKNHGQVLFATSKKDSISSSINHLVHHRGQLTVYMRLNDIPVPSIYGPSADEQKF